MLYADVCVNTPLGRRVGASLGADIGDDPSSRTFTYAVPVRLESRLLPGHLVWVTFRSRRMQAVVLSLGDTAPDFETHEIEAVVWSQPPLTPAQLVLARWISAYYLSPLIEALRLMLPVGISQRGRTVLVRTQEVAPPGLTASQAAVLQRISEAEGTWAEISEGLSGVTQRADLEPLIAQGLVAREVAFLTPPPRPKFDRQVHLIAGEQAIVRALPGLGRNTRQADILAWLIQQDDPLPTLNDLRRAVGCSEAPVRALAARGWISIVPRRARIRRTRTAVDGPSGAGKGAVAARQAAALAALPADPVDEAEFRAAHEVDAATLRALIDQGLAQRIEEPALVTLILDRPAAMEALLTLRGVEKHRTVLNALQRHDGPAWIGWVYAETGANLATLRDLEAAGLISVTNEMVWRDPLAGRDFPSDQPPVLTGDQERVWEAVEEQIDRSIRPVLVRDEDEMAGSWPFLEDEEALESPSAMLLYGVTGSGKTEIYLRAIDEVLRHGRQAVVLVPEIALTPQTIRRFAARFPGKVTVWHSELSDGERFDVWRRVRTGHPAARVVVGSRSALLLPFPDLGLIVVDEEHESSYKQERTPRYHARTAAIELGRICRIPVLLGSATPALETYYAARQGKLALLSLPRRIVGHQKASEEQPQGSMAGKAAAAVPLLAVVAQPAAAPLSDLPGVQIVDMRQELRVGNRSMFSRSLGAALKQVLAANQQAILYLNRRGATTFVLCRDCGHVETCPRCAVPLAYHSTGDILLCHHCNRRYPVPHLCPECGSSRIRYFGSGTQNVEATVQQAFPGARTLRWDRDVTGSKGSHDAILARFISHEADILVGTQMIAKGLDLPLVTLVGVVAADIGLFLPDFRTGERTFQLLTQVAGRAGRSALGGQVIVQTYHPDHYAIVAAGHHDYEGFYRQEMAFRREQNYPPLSRLVKLIYYHTQTARRPGRSDAHGRRAARPDRPAWPVRHRADRARAVLFRAGTGRLSLADRVARGRSRPAPPPYQHPHRLAAWTWTRSTSSDPVSDCPDRSSITI